MKRTTTRFIRYSAGFVVGVLGLVIGIRLLWTPRQVTFWLDPRFSYEIQQQLRLAFTPTSIRSANSQAVSTLLGPIAPTVARARVRYVGASTAYVQIDSVHPFVLINDTFVFSRKTGAEAGVWGLRDTFKDEIVARLPRVTVLDKQINTERVRKELFAFLSALPIDLFDRYEIIWYDKTHIDLIERENPNHILMAWYRTRFDDKLRSVLQSLQIELEEKQSEKKGNAKKRRDAWHRDAWHRDAWRIDLRMEGQAVLRSK